MRFRLALLLLAACAGRADVRNCICDLANSATTETRGCSLCLEAEKHPISEKIFLTKDNDPAKPNRWLAIPRNQFDGPNPLAQMSAEERLLLWTTAMAKAREIWGSAWAIAMNGDIARRQCHAHVHIGKLLDDQPDDQTGFYAIFYIDSPAQLPAISDGTGVWFHPLGGRLHVHAGGQTNETVLMR